MRVPAVSVVMVVRDGARYLDEAIASIRAQTFTDWELIAVDDGSTDATPAILKQHASEEPRIRVITTPPRGLVAGLNAAIAEARAPLIARMDADDAALPERFTRQAAFLGQHPDVLAVGTAIEIIDADGRRGEVRRFPTQAADIVRTLARTNALAHPSVMMRRAALDEAGGYRAPYVCAQDYDLWLRLAERGPLANLADVLLLYREHAGQHTLRRQIESRLAAALARHLALRRRHGLAEELDVNADLGANALAALDRELRTGELPLDTEAAFVMLRLAEGAAGLRADAAKTARAAVDAALRTGLRRGNPSLAFKALRAYVRLAAIARANTSR